MNGSWRLDSEALDFELAVEGGVRSGAVCSE